MIANTSLIPQLLEGLNHDNANIKFGSDKILRLISEQKPALLYTYFDVFVNRLDSENTILKWGAIIIISKILYL